MKAKNFIFGTIFLSLICGSVFADRQLSRAEILEIFKQITTNPGKTWIPAGTIEAKHEEYRAPKVTNPIEISNQIQKNIRDYQSNPSKQGLTQDLQKMRLDAIPFNTRYELSNKCTMNSDVILKFDGDRFYWEINVTSRTDSVKPDENLAGNFMTNHFDLNWNAKRIFAWDGEKYTTYSLSGNHAIVDTTGDTPQAVNGPLTAGFIPWGYGYCSYENLTAADSSAVEKYSDGRTQVHLTLNNSDGSVMSFVMDPEKDYAVLSCSIDNQTDSVISRHYSDYQLISGNWVPATILLEQYEAGSNRLLARDLWDITHIDGNTPAGYDFDIRPQDNALIEYFSPVDDESQMYRYSEMADTDLLLAERLEFAANEGLQPQNCATAAIKLVASRLGKKVTDKQLTQLIDQSDGTTSLYAIKQLAKDLGLYCRAVTTDIDTLKSLYDCQIILHIPGKKHFVVLDHIDSEQVWTIDLSGNKFFYSTDIGFFDMDWTRGVAFLISNSPIKGEFTEIDDGEIQEIIGAYYYDCNIKIQIYHVILCDYVGGLCEGYYRMFPDRWVCGYAESGSCSPSMMVRYRKIPCINNPYYPLACTVTGEWTFYYMLACK